MTKQTIPEIFYEAAAKYADLPAVRWNVRKQTLEKTYSELLKDADAVRHALLRAGLGGTHIALCGPSSYNWIAAYLGILMARGAAVPLDVSLPTADQGDLVRRADVKAVFAAPEMSAFIEEVQNNCPQVEKLFLLKEDPEDGSVCTGFPKADPAGSAQNAAPEEASPDDLCTIIFTSGTTGKSKGVMLLQKNLAENVNNVYIDVDPGTTLLSVLPIHHAFCLVMDWLKGFSAGATICINDSPLHMIRNLKRFQPDLVLMVPLMIETIYKLLKSADASVPKKAVAAEVLGGNLKYIFAGGAHLDPSYIDAFAEYGVQIFEGYGMSECSPVISSNGQLASRPGSVGKPLDNVEIRFEDGEILVRGSSVMAGYYHMPEETAAALEEDGWLHTGDLGRMDEDGFLYITGRLKNLIILSNGENVSPEEIEEKLRMDPLVSEVVVIGDAEGLAAYIFPEPDYIEKAGIAAEEVQGRLQALLDEFNKSQPSYRYLTRLVVRKNPFWKNTTRKIIRAKIDIDLPQE